MVTFWLSDFCDDRGGQRHNYLARTRQPSYRPARGRNRFGTIDHLQTARGAQQSPRLPGVQGGDSVRQLDRARPDKCPKPCHMGEANSSRIDHADTHP